MKCPIDETLLQISDRQGIEIDFCPQCRGVWLDRGELDKLIERAAAEYAGAAPGRPPGRSYGDDDRWQPPRRYDDDDDHRRSGRYDDDDDRYRYGKKKKRGGFLGDLFDFD
jgi:uncharacterized protein